ncbi:hypothetical protein FO519_009057 [Halicephalobus sp. NKZ332]|nr:hypothetical protein FO519_009057 [Halicephalobus sp. NKZ332]
MQEDWLDILRSYMVIAYIFVLLPSSIASVTDKHSTTEIGFRAYRLRQFELGGSIHGPRSSKVSWDAVSLGSEFVRKAAILEWRDLVGKDVQNTLQAGMGAVLIIIPSELSVLNKEERQAFLNIESQLSTFDTDQAVYFVEDCQEIRLVLIQVAESGGKAPTATKQLMNALVSNNYVLTSTVTANPPVLNVKQFNVIATLTSGDSKSPTIVLSTHYDSAGLAPAKAVQADSNGSGVAALLEIYVALRQFYSKGNRPRYNIIFAFTAAGKYNYQGTRQFVDNLGEKEDVELSLCLDSLGNGDQLYMQVARIPKDESPVKKMFNRISYGFSSLQSMEMNHKKINTAAETLAWEHEMFLLRKKQAVTLTHFKDHNDPMRDSLLDTKENVDLDVLYKNTKAIVNGILSFIYDLDESLCADALADSVECSFVGKNVVSKERLKLFLDAVLGIPRHAEVSDTYAKFLKDVLDRYGGKTQLQPVKFSDAVIYGHTEDKITAHVTKPAVFEIVVGLIVAVYLYLFYHFTLNLEPFLTGLIAKWSKEAQSH